MDHMSSSSLRGRLPDASRRTRGTDRSSVHHGSRPAPVLSQEESWNAYRVELQHGERYLRMYDAFSGEMAISDRRLVGSLPRRFSTNANRVPTPEDYVHRVAERQSEIEYPRHKITHDTTRHGVLDGDSLAQFHRPSSLTFLRERVPRTSPRTWVTFVVHAHAGRSD